jgi:hypothetical protein
LFATGIPPAHIYAKNVGEVDMYLIDAEKGEERTILREDNFNEKVTVKQML